MPEEDGAVPTEELRRLLAVEKRFYGAFSEAPGEYGDAWGQAHRDLLEKVYAALPALLDTADRERIQDVILEETREFGCFSSGEENDGLTRVRSRELAYKAKYFPALSAWLESVKGKPLGGIGKAEHAAGMPIERQE